MNKFISTNATAKLSFKATNKIKLTYDLLFDRGRSQGFSRTYKYNPDGRPTSRSIGQSHSFGLTHAIGNKFFYTLKGAYSESVDKTYLYEDPRDARYVPFDLATTIPNTGFLAGGTDLNHDRADARTFNIKFDAVSQFLRNHEVKLGAEARVHRLEREFFSLIYDTTMARSGQAPIVPYRYLNPEYTNYIYYLRRPQQFAAYILDKMELARTFIVNAGLRVEYLDTKSNYNPDLVANAEEPEQNLQRTSSKLRLSPRISFSYPITDRGIIRFSYGHFYQMPTLASLYRNPFFESFNYIVTPTYGDPNLEPERSIQYEMGLQQQLGDDFKFDLTIYYKDVNNLLQTRQVLAGTVGDRVFNILTNVSYANVRGFSFSLLKRRGVSSPFSATIDYTFQIAEGNLSDPTDNFFDAKSGKETEQTFVFLDHDRTHTLNGTFTLGKPNNWNVSALASFWAGSPYTPVLPASLSPVTFRENSGRRPTFLNVDFRAEKFFKVSKFGFSVFTQIENVFDIQNERFVFSSSGSALSAIEEKTSASTLSILRRQFAARPDLFPPVSELDNFYRRAEWLSEPREVRVGFSVSF
jgi:outer membrane receptor protein involved in Fe transport